MRHERTRTMYIIRCMGRESTVINDDFPNNSILSGIFSTSINNKKNTEKKTNTMKSYENGPCVIDGVKFP